MAPKGRSSSTVNSTLSASSSPASSYDAMEPPAEASRVAATRRFTDYGLRLDSDNRWQLIEPLPTERAALEAELQRLDATIACLENDDESDLLKGCAILEARKKEYEAQARARYDRVEALVTMLFEHECEQARVRYASRCEQLKLDMGNAIQREIRRLRHARDGVAVMDRRRLTRHSGNNGNNSSNGSGAGGDLSGHGYDGTGGGDSSSYGAHLTEKKRMEVLLSATPIFRQLDKKIPADQVTTDLDLIKGSMPTFLNDDANGVVDDSTDEEEEQELEELRRQATMQGNTFKRRRLMYTPDRVREGQEVVVYRTMSTPSGKKQLSRGDDSPNQRTELASGVITAATPRQVFLLTEKGTFATIEVSDWKAGRVTVHLVDKRAEQ